MLLIFLIFLTLMAPSRVLRRVVDEIHNIGWITKSTHFQSHQYVCADTYDAACSSCGASATLSYDQPSMGSLTGFSIPRPFLHLRWLRSRYGLDGRQCNHLLRWFPKLHVNSGDVVESPPRGALLFGVGFDLGLEPDLLVYFW